MAASANGGVLDLLGALRNGYCLPGSVLLAQPRDEHLPGRASNNLTLVGVCVTAHGLLQVS